MAKQIDASGVILLQMHLLRNACGALHSINPFGSFKAVKIISHLWGISFYQLIVQAKLCMQGVKYSKLSGFYSCTIQFNVNIFVHFAHIFLKFSLASFVFLKTLGTLAAQIHL